MKKNSFLIFLLLICISINTLESEGFQPSHQTIGTQHQSHVANSVENVTQGHIIPTGSHNLPEGIVTHITNNNAQSGNFAEENNNVSLADNLQITSPKDKTGEKIFIDDLEQKKFERNQDLIKRLRANENLALKKTLGQTLDAMEPDTRIINQRINNFEKANRITTKNMLTYLESRKRFSDEDKINFGKKLIQTHLDNLFGVNNISFESTVSFDYNSNKQFLNDLISDDRLFEINKNNQDIHINRAQAIASAGDKIMNMLASFDENQTPIATFETIIDRDGNYMTTITDPNNGISSRSIIDVNGKTTLQEISIPNKDKKTASTFVTTLDNKGKLRTTMDDGTGKISLLTSWESSLSRQMYIFFKTRVLCKAMIKLTFWTGKQAAINVVTHPIPITFIAASIIPLVVLVKTASLAVGISYERPAVLATFKGGFDFICANKRGLMSNNQDRVFTKGTTISNAINAINPFGDTGPQTKDPREEYYGIDNDVIDLATGLIKEIFPDTFGDRLLPLKNLPSGSKNAIQKSNIDTATINQTSDQINPAEENAASDISNPYGPFFQNLSTGAQAALQLAFRMVDVASVLIR